MSRDLWPPGEGGAAPPGTARHHHHRQPLTKGQHQKTNAEPRYRVGPYAEGWLHGFAHGFHDALRLAGRRLPQETWPIIEALADEYALAGSDE